MNPTFTSHITLREFGMILTVYCSKYVELRQVHSDKKNHSPPPKVCETSLPLSPLSASDKTMRHPPSGHGRTSPFPFACKIQLRATESTRSLKVLLARWMEKELKTNKWGIMATKSRCQLFNWKFFEVNVCDDMINLRSLTFTMAKIQISLLAH